MKNKYETVMVVENVLVQIPNESPQLRLVKTHEIETADGKVTVQWHWTHGLGLKGGIFLNRNFYGIGKSIFGKKITETVKIVKKMTEKDEWVMLDVTRVDAPARSKLMICDAQREETDIPILHTEQFIHFEPIAQAA